MSPARLVERALTGVEQHQGDENWPDGPIFVALFSIHRDRFRPFFDLDLGPSDVRFYALDLDRQIP